MVKAIVGANWGDEGKGKITDVLAEDADVVARFQGGANAGHTIKNRYGKFALHTCPSGVFNENVTNVIGSGVALDVMKLKSEVDEIVSKGVPRPAILISERVQLLMPYHWIPLNDWTETDKYGNPVDQDDIVYGGESYVINNNSYIVKEIDIKTNSAKLILNNKEIWIFSTFLKEI